MMRDLGTLAKDLVSARLPADRIHWNAAKTSATIAFLFVLVVGNVAATAGLESAIEAVLADIRSVILRGLSLLLFIYAAIQLGVIGFKGFQARAGKKFAVAFFAAVALLGFDELVIPFIEALSDTAVEETD